MKAKQKKTILITGASSGIGFETARQLARQGHKVYAAARRTDLMEPLRADGVEVLRMDVTDEASMQQGVDHIMAAEGHIDVLSNNAGYGYFGAIENVTMDEARRQQEVNVFGLARLCQMVLPSMRERGSGRIINTASVAGKAVLYFGGWYNVSKFSVEALSDALREAASFRKVYSINLLSKPSVVTRAMLRAVNSRRPRARYRIGFAARTIVFFHGLLPARWWDGIMRMLGKVKF